MFWLPIALFTRLRSFLLSRHNLALEIIALRQQLIVLQRRSRRPRIQPSDRLFWVVLRRIWPPWIKSLLIVKPETVIGWHRHAFRLYWRFRSSSKKVGRPNASVQIRQ
jgi:putative transposase